MDEEHRAPHRSHNGRRTLRVRGLSSKLPDQPHDALSDLWRHSQHKSLGLGYIVPIATLVKWLPDKRWRDHRHRRGGVVATTLISKQLVPALGPLNVFWILGLIYL